MLTKKRKLNFSFRETSNLRIHNKIVMCVEETHNGNKFLNHFLLRNATPNHHVALNVGITLSCGQTLKDLRQTGWVLCLDL